MYKLLVVEDEIRMQEIIKDYFGASGYDVRTVGKGIDALTLLEEEDIDLILLDIMMPGLDGFGVCKTVREKYVVPIIFLTAKGDEDDQLYGYELGADDYITKPFSLSVLMAKVNSLIKRAKGEVIERKIILGDLKIDCRNYQVYVQDKEVKLAPKEYEILTYLVQNQHQIITREQLLTRIWGYDFEGNDRVIDTHMKKLRKALGICGGYIQTVIKIGYRFEVKS